jgi:hypothetical protein
MPIQDLCSALENTAFGTFIRESALVFPAIESIHVMGIAMVVGGIGIIDLRLLGVLSRGRLVTRVSSELLPWVWGTFVVAVVTGLLMFSSLASVYCANTFFLLKMGVLALAGLNMLAFHLITYKKVAVWDAGAPPRTARIAGGVSLSAWVLVVFFGRWIGFTL